MTTSVFIKTLIFLCSVCLLGFFIDSVISCICRKKEMNTANLCGLPLFFILGGGAYAFFEMFFSILGIKSSIAHFMLLLAVFSLIHIIFYLKVKGINQQKFAPHINNKKKALLIIIVALVILIPLVMNLIMAMAFPQFDIDMVSYILMKAKLFITDTHKSSVFLHDTIFVGMHARYPPFVGMFFNLLFLFGCKTVSCYQIVNYFILLLLGLSICAYLRNRVSLWESLAWFFIFMSTPGYISSQFIIDSTDVLLSLVFLSAVFWLIEFYKRQDMHSLIVCIILAGFSTLIKNEALLFSLIVIFMLIWLNGKQPRGYARGTLITPPALLRKTNGGVIPPTGIACSFSDSPPSRSFFAFIQPRQRRGGISRRRDKRVPLLYLLIWLAISLPWLLYRQVLPNDNNPEALIKMANIIGAVKYIRHASGIAFSILFKNWNSAFILWIPSLIILLKSKYKREAVFFSIVTGVMLFVYFIMLCLQINIEFSYRNVFFRILCHIYPMAFICVALALSELMGGGIKISKE